MARDDDLRLVIHVEQEGRFNYTFLFAYLIHRDPKCPYSQVFAFGVAPQLTVVSAPPLNQALERMRGTPTLFGRCPARRWHMK